jgi:hypothetical protein
MSTERAKGRIWSAYLLGAVTVFAATILATGLTPRAAQAQIPDSGAQRNAMIKELNATNKKLGEIIVLLREIRDKTPGEQKPAQPRRGTVKKTPGT